MVEKLGSLQSLEKIPLEEKQNFSFEDQNRTLPANLSAKDAFKQFVNERFQQKELQLQRSGLPDIIYTEVKLLKIRIGDFF